MDSILDGPEELLIILLVVILALCFGERTAVLCSDNTEVSAGQRPLRSSRWGRTPCVCLTEPVFRFTHLCPLVPFLAQTLYSVKAEILPPVGAEHCRTGALCALEVCVTRLADLLEADRDEALTQSDEYLSTKLMYEGRSRGFLSLTAVLIRCFK